MRTLLKTFSLALFLATASLAQAETYELDGHWVEVRPGLPVPQQTVRGGTDIDQRKLVICRAPMGQGVHPGKVRDGYCHFGYGGSEHRVTTFEVLVGNSINRLWVSQATNVANGSTGRPLSGSVLAEGGLENGQPLRICRAMILPFASLQPGKLLAGHCNIPFNGREHRSSLRLEVLYSKVVLGDVKARVWEHIDRQGESFDVIDDGDIPAANGSSLAVYSNNWVVFYADAQFGGSELRVKGPTYISDLTNYVKMNGPCVGGATTLPPGDWNDEITSARIVTPSWSPDSCGTNCPVGSAAGYCGPALPPPPFLPLRRSQ